SRPVTSAALDHFRLRCPGQTTRPGHRRRKWSSAADVTGLDLVVNAGEDCLVVVALWHPLFLDLWVARDELPEIPACQQFFRAALAVLTSNTSRGRSAEQ